MALIHAKAGWVAALCLSMAAALVLVAPPLAEAAISCGQVRSTLAPCISYLENGGAPTGKCCSGVAALNNAAKTTPDRQQACKCLQQAAVSIPAIKENFAAALPGKCGVSIPYKISRSTNCAAVK
ncbi:non-specific lipid-transfer protein 1-like [Diospyros lotus]|uniref:non-specific lipid-transfer protein 1-like n=1 Tax=Diospyros lotus TaxID=55363 RepID=UPI00224EFB04|nr:non-specific lipid-transfer protein 1-like [Diospyros lotus]